MTKFSKRRLFTKVITFNRFSSKDNRSFGNKLKLLEKYKIIRLISYFIKVNFVTAISLLEKLQQQGIIIQTAQILGLHKNEW